MSLTETLILVLYFFVLSILAIYGWHRYYLVYLYMKHKGNVPPALPPPQVLPRVTVQLPIFNEMYVADRLIDAVCEIDYPRELLEIQVLDDSTDETTEIAELAVRRHAARGFDIKYLHRVDRTGYKAGALEAGLQQASGEFIAIFDADFVPPKDFLLRTLGYFERDPKVGMVQARWGHLNRDYSLLTRIQSILLDAHFVLEHGGRNRAGCFFNFNGTAGVWRRETIGDAGGWQHDTLTEDLDLSYRAQLKGWRFIFMPDLVSPAEVPVEMNSFKSQQHRWAKGSIQTCIKLMPRILRSSQPLAVKAEAFFHLSANFNYLLMSLLSLLMFPGDGGALQHGLDRDDAHRRAALPGGDGVGRQLLHRLAARAVCGLEAAAQIRAVPDVDRHRPLRQQHAGRDRSDVRQAERVCPHAEVRYRAKR